MFYICSGLNVTSNGITNITSLAQPITTLTEVNLSNNPITDWKEVLCLSRVLPNLKILALNECPLRNIDFFEDGTTKKEEENGNSEITWFPSLTTLQLSACKIDNWTSVEALNVLSRLANFKFKFNPVLEKEQLGLFQIKEDRQPVGLLSGDLEPFTNHGIKLISGDIIYAFSDGFQDQFGGPKGKKFMIKRLKNLLMDVGAMPIKAQRDVLDQNLMGWINSENTKGEVFNQVDDVLVIGVEIV